jgi:hypothetical protein
MLVIWRSVLCKACEQDVRAAARDARIEHRAVPVSRVEDVGGPHIPGTRKGRLGTGKAGEVTMLLGVFVGRSRDHPSSSSNLIPF